MLTLFVFAALWQATAVPPRAPQPQPVKAEDRGSVKGTVSNAKTGEPLKKATVMAQKMDASSYTVFAAMTDAAGKYKIERLEPGKYAVSASRTGFAQGRHGAKPGAPWSISGQVTVEKAQTLQEIDIQLVPHGVVTGRVVDDDAEPVAGVEVRSTRYGYNYETGKRMPFPSASAKTDDRGQYRLFGLTPGKYFIVAVHRPSWDMAQARGDASLEQAFYAPTYYPGTTSPASAAEIEVTSGAEVAGIDLQLLREQSYRVSGRIGNMQPGRHAQITLMPAGSDSGFPWDSMVHAQADREGAFQLRGVRPGRYRLTAQSWSQEQQSQSASLQLTVSDGDLDGVVLTLGSGAEIPGSIRVEGGELPKGEKRVNGIALTPADELWGYDGAGGEVKDDGSFRLKNVQTEKYRVNLHPQPEGYYVVSLRLGQEVMAGNILDLTSGGGSGELTITLSANGAEITGLTTGEDKKPKSGAVVALVPDDRSRRDRFYSSSSDQNGRYTLKGVAPGNYKLFAWAEAEWGSWFDPDFLKPFEDDATTITTKEKDRLMKDIGTLVTESAKSGGTTQ